MKFLLFVLFCAAANLCAAHTPGNYWFNGACDGGTMYNKSAQDYNAVLTDTSRNPSASRKDSIKYFPKLLNDGMGINFDPNKYVVPNRHVVDTALVPEQTAVLNKVARKDTALLTNVTVKSSIANKKAGDSTAIASVKPVVKDSTVYKNKALQKDTAQTMTITVGKLPVKRQNTTIQAAPKGKKAALSKAAKDTVTALSVPQKDTVAALPTPVKDTTPAAITQRTTSLVNTFKVSSPHISVQLYDDGQIDGDAVSVYYNGTMIINNQTLTHKAITFNIEASAASRHHEFTLVAESEGFLPPNTALMRIKAGDQQFELNVSSSSEHNVKIAIDYTGE